MGAYQQKRAERARNARAPGGAGTPAAKAAAAKTALKGKYDGNCNRTACQEPIKGRNFWNTSTRAYYCRNCAHGINHWSLKDDGIRICVAVSDPNERPQFKIVEPV